MSEDLTTHDEAASDETAEAHSATARRMGWLAVFCAGALCGALATRSAYRARIAAGRGVRRLTRHLPGR